MLRGLRCQRGCPLVADIRKLNGITLPLEGFVHVLYLRQAEACSRLCQRMRLLLLLLLYMRLLHMMLLYMLLVYMLLQCMMLDIELLLLIVKRLQVSLSAAVQGVCARPAQCSLIVCQGLLLLQCPLLVR